MARVFNEWARRYADNPAEFGEQLDGDGKPFDDYGDACAAYFARLADEMDATDAQPRALIRAEAET
jgi:hypothetical protein